jgi:hypothetical protein
MQTMAFMLRCAVSWDANGEAKRVCISGFPSLRKAQHTCLEGTDLWRVLGPLKSGENTTPGTPRPTAHLNASVRECGFCTLGYCAAFVSRISPNCTTFDKRHCTRMRMYEAFASYLDTEPFGPFSFPPSLQIGQDEQSQHGI